MSNTTITGLQLSVGVSWGGKQGLQPTDFSVTPQISTQPRRPDSGSSSDEMVPADRGDPLAVVGVSAAGSVGTGMVLRALQPGKDALNAKDMLLDGLVGAQLGSGLVGGPRAESFFYGGAFSLPLQFINSRRDDQWDYRIGMLTQGMLAVARDAAGGYPMPFDGVERDTHGQMVLDGPELLGNAATEIGFDATYYGLGNTLAAVAQGKSDAAGEYAKIGALYGAITRGLTNAVVGAPYQPDPESVAEGVELVARGDGPDVAEMQDETIWRAGGLFQVISDSWGITLGRNVWMGERLLDSETTLGHELVHRDQIAGARERSGDGHVREGHGGLSFYAQYLAWSAEYGYLLNPYETEAYYHANGYDFGPYAGGELTGDALGSSLLLGTFALANSTMTPASAAEPSQAARASVFSVREKP